MRVKSVDTNNQLRISKGLLKETAVLEELPTAEGSFTLVFDNPDLRHGFVQVPVPVLKDGRLTGADKLLYALLLMYARQERRCFPGQGVLSLSMGCSVNTMRNSMTHLQEHKLIKIERRGQGKVSIYHIRKLSDGFLPKQILDKGGHG